MAYLRLENGNDVTVKLSVQEALDALGDAAEGSFLELAGDDGPVHVRPASVIAILEGGDRKTPGFRPSGG